MYENYLDSRSHSFGTSSSSRTVLPRRSSRTVLPHRSSRTVLPAPYFPLRTSPPFFPHRFPAYAIKTESGTSCTVSLSTPQDRIAAETHVGMLRVTCSLQFCLRLSPPNPPAIHPTNHLANPPAIHPAALPGLVFASVHKHNCSRDTHRDATGDVFIAILLTVISFDHS